MSQTTGEEMLNRINATLDVLQNAQEEAVTAVRDVAAHKIDPEAHGDLLRSAVEAAVDEALGGASAEELAALQEALATLAGRFDAGGKLLPANLPLATKAALGAVRIGGGLSVTAQGLLAASSLIQSRRAATTLYVRADGNDSRDGLTAQTSLKTVRRAYLRLKELDLGNFEGVIDVGAGTFDVSGLELGRTTLSSPRATLRGQGAATVLNVSSDYFGFTVSSWWRIENVKILLAKDTFVNNIGAFLTFAKTTFTVSGVSTEPHLSTTFSGVTNLDSGCAFTGSSSCAANADAGGVVRILGNISVNGVFSLATMTCGGGSVIRRAESTLPTISGTSTGCRYNVGANGVIQSVGGGPSWIPGSKAGVAANGGIYI